MSLPHRKAFELLQARADGTLDPASQARLAAHLAACPACRADAALSQALLAAGEALPLPEPDHHLTRQVLQAVQGRTGARRRLRRFTRSAAPALWVGLAILLVVLSGLLFNSLTPQPAVTPPTTPRSPSWTIPRPRPLRVSEPVLEAVRSTQAQASFDLRVPTNLPSGWEFTASRVDPSGRQFDLHFQRESIVDGSLERLLISQRLLDSDAPILQDAARTFIPPGAPAEKVQVGGHLGLYLEGEARNGGWEAGRPVWRVIWQAGALLYEVQHHGNVIGRSTLLQISTDLRSLSEIESSDYLRVMDIEPQALHTGRLATLGGRFGALAIQGPYAYAGLGARLAVLDVRDPQAITLMGSLPLPEPPYAIQVSGPYAFVAGGRSGLHVVDISSPGSPRVVGNFRLAQVYQPLLVLDLAIEGDYAYLAWQSDQIYTTSGGASGKSGLQVVDIRSPQDPTLVGLYTSNRPAERVRLAASGRFAYLSTGACTPASCQGRLTLIDVSDPSLPQEVDDLAEDRLIRDLQATPEGVFLAWERCLPEGGCTGGITLVTASGRGQVEMLPGATRPFPARNLAWEGAHLVVSFEDGVRIFERRATGDLVEAGLYRSQTPVQAIAATGGRLYVSAPLAGLQILDITSPGRITPTGRYAPPVEAWRVEAAGDHLLVLDFASRSVAVLDLSIPEAPRPVASLGEAGDNLLDLALSGERAFLLRGDCAGERGGCWNTLEVWDVSALPGGSMLGRVETEPAWGEIATQVQVIDTLAFLIGSEDLWLIDITDPAAPALLAHQPLQRLYATHLDVARETLFVTGVNGLRVFDIRNPSFPERLRPEADAGGRFPRAMAEAQGVARVGETVYVSTRSGLWSLASWEPLKFEQVKSFNARTGRGILQARGGLLFLGTDRGLLVLEAAGPTGLQVIGAYEPLAGVRDLAVVGDILYVVDGWGGLTVLRFTP